MQQRKVAKLMGSFAQSEKSLKHNKYSVWQYPKSACSVKIKEEILKRRMKNDLQLSCPRLVCFIEKFSRV